MKLKKSEHKKVESGEIGGLDYLSPVVPKMENLSFVDKSHANAWSPPTPTSSKKNEEIKSPPIEDELSKQNLYKTELCRSFCETGACRYGHKCQFAHGLQELRPVLRHPKYKTETCKKFATTGHCSYGSRCRFIHPVAGSSPETSPSSSWSTSWAQPSPVRTTERTIDTAPKKQAPIGTPPDGAEIRRLAVFQNIAF